MTRTVAILATAASIALVCPATAQTTEKPMDSKTMESSSTMPAKHSLAGFAREAAMGGMSEVELGRLATQKASNPRVKEFGQKMVDDHTKANSELKKAAADAGITLPTAADSEQKALADKLSKLSGPEFDKAYMKDMVKDHEKDVAAFEKAAKSEGEPAVKTFAEKTLPTLQDHLKMAKDVDQAVTHGS